MTDWTRRTVCQTLAASPLILHGRRARAETGTALTAIEQRLGGRLGVSAGSADAGRLGHRAEEAFPMCSTFKVLLAAAVLAQVDAGAAALNQSLAFGPDDLISNAPVSRTVLEAGHGRGEMTLAQACAAALEWSDNTAANLLLGRLSGPAALTAWLRRTGDPITRLDRTEPSLNTAIPDDPRDTTTPTAMRETLGRILLGSTLAPTSRAQLEAWMIASQTGFKRLRSGLPKAWPVGDKTGTGENGSYNDVAILRPPGRDPMIVTVYITGSTAPVAICDAAYTEIGRLVAQAVVE